ncbi:MAG TPA: hypothetical protein VN580_00080, partial [Clostridia bacterium]|nr:hypothetical protein [Clostridia bacterium]
MIKTPINPIFFSCNRNDIELSYSLKTHVYLSKAARPLLFKGRTTIERVEKIKMELWHKACSEYI